MTKQLDINCQDNDSDCPHCGGTCTRNAEVVLVRIDQADVTGTLFCDVCADDASGSGVFKVKALVDGRLDRYLSGVGWSATANV